MNLKQRTNKHLKFAGKLLLAGTILGATYLGLGAIQQLSNSSKRISDVQRRSLSRSPTYSLELRSSSPRTHERSFYWDHNTDGLIDESVKIKNPKGSAWIVLRDFSQGKYSASSFEHKTAPDLRTQDYEFQTKKTTRMSEKERQYYQEH